MLPEYQKAFTTMKKILIMNEAKGNQEIIIGLETLLETCSKDRVLLETMDAFIRKDSDRLTMYLDFIASGYVKMISELDKNDLSLS